MFAMYPLFDDFLRAALNATPAIMKHEAIVAYRKTKLFSPERRQLAEVFIQTAEALNEVRLSEFTSTSRLHPSGDAQTLAIKSAYCLQSAFILSRTSRAKSQHKRASSNFALTIADLKQFKETNASFTPVIAIKYDLVAPV